MKVFQKIVLLMKWSGPLLRCKLQEHIKLVHESVKDFQCTICQKAFGLNSKLQDHIKLVHEKIKDFKCKLCPKTFGQNHKLKEHIKIVHENIKDHSCSVCQRMRVAVPSSQLLAGWFWRVPIRSLTSCW